MTIQERFYTVEDLWAMSHDPENDLRRFELSEGMLIEMTPAGVQHGKYALKFGRRMGNFVEDNKLGETTAAETGYILFRNPAVWYQTLTEYFSNGGCGGLGFCE